MMKDSRSGRAMIGLGVCAVGVCLCLAFGALHFLGAPVQEQPTVSQGSGIRQNTSEPTGLPILPEVTAKPSACDISGHSLVEVRKADGGHGLDKYGEMGGVWHNVIYTYECTVCGYTETRTEQVKCHGMMTGTCIDIN